MKQLIIFTCLFFTTSSWSQTIVWEKNKETATYNNRIGISTTLQSSFQVDTELTDELFDAIEGIFSQKNGYIQITRVSSNKIILTYESWLNLDDFIGIMGYHGYVLKKEIGSVGKQE